MEKIKILAVHGLWSKENIFTNFKRWFYGGLVLSTINIEWDSFNSLQLAKKINKISPDVIIGYSYGAYAIQKVFSLYQNYLNSVNYTVLICPVGPNGMSIRTLLNHPLSTIKTVVKKVYCGPEEKYGIGSFVSLLPESRKTILKTFSPFCEKIKKPIPTQTLIIAGEKDTIVPLHDAEKTAKFHKAEITIISDKGHLLLGNDIVLHIKYFILSKRHS